jgi:hypothetical protein
LQRDDEDQGGAEDEHEHDADVDYDPKGATCGETQVEDEDGEFDGEQGDEVANVVEVPGRGAAVQFVVEVGEGLGFVCLDGMLGILERMM